MKCRVCGSKMGAMITDLPFKVSETTIIILKELPVFQCDNCSEYLLDDPVLKRVEEMLEEAQPKSLQSLVRRLEAAHFPSCSISFVALCRLDYNTHNFVRRSGSWASVDWENSGWGDPAFDIAELMTHPTYMDVPGSRWEWMTDAYCTLTGDVTAATRIQVYYKIIAVQWVARLACLLYEVPRGLDQRLVDRPDNWQADMQAKYEHYVNLATSLM